MLKVIRQGVEQLGSSFGSIFLCFYESGQEPCSLLLEKSLFSGLQPSKQSCDSKLSFSNNVQLFFYPPTIETVFK